MNTMDYICLRDCNTLGLKIDPKLYINKDTVYSFKKGGIYTVYGELKNTKAIYDESLSTDEYDFKFKGWITEEFMLNNFIEMKAFKSEIIRLDELFLSYIEDE